MEEQTSTPFEMRLSDVPTMPSPQLDLTYATAIPSNGGVFTQNQEVRIPFNVPSECFVDLKRAYLTYNLTNTSGVKLYLDPVIGGATVIDTMRIVGGTGALLEEIIHYNAYYASLKMNDNHAKNSSLGHEQEGAGTDSCLDFTNSIAPTQLAETLDAVGITQLAIAGTRGITHRPASGFMNADRYMPLGYTQGVSYMSITLCSDATAMIAGNDATGSGYSVSNWELHLPILRPGPEFSAMFRSAMASGVPIQIHSVSAQNTQQTITGGEGTETLTFSTRKRSVKSLVSALRINSAITNVFNASVSGFVNAGITKYNFSVGGVRIPAQEIAVSESNKGQLLANTQLALGYFNSDLRGVDCISALNTAQPVSIYYRSLGEDFAGKISKCLFCLDLESYNASYAGKNLAGQGLPLVLHCLTGNGAQAIGSPIVDCWVIHDVMYVLEGMTGVINANS
jgi:hypothetical protein